MNIANLSSANQLAKEAEDLAALSKREGRAREAITESFHAQGSALDEPAHKGGITMHYRENRPAEELVSEIKRIDEALVLYEKKNCESKDVRPLWQRGGPEAYDAAIEDRRARYDRFHELLRELGANHREDFLALRKEVGARIDPATAETLWIPRDPFDPYMIHPELPVVEITELCFVYAPDSKISVWSHDLPHETRQALRLKIGEERAAFEARRASSLEEARQEWGLRELSERAASQLQGSKA